MSSDPSIVVADVALGSLRSDVTEVATVSFDHVMKKFGDVVALNDFSLQDNRDQWRIPSGIPGRRGLPPALPVLILFAKDDHLILDQVTSLECATCPPHSKTIDH